jgi:hypothetical protein
MPAVLVEHQLEILDVNNENRALVFGTEDTGYLTLSPPQWVGGDVRDGDLDRAQEDGRYFGRDYRTGASVGFEIGVLTDKVNGLDDGYAYRSNVDYAERLSSWWDDERLRSRPWELAMLRFCVAGRTWRAYGRPRRFEVAPTRLQQQGYAPVVCDFAVMDNSVYSDDFETLTVPLMSRPDGGLTAPLTEPLTATPGTEGEREITITGSRSTWPWIQFVGPSTSAQVQLIRQPDDDDPEPFSVTVGLSTSIPGSGAIVTVDPRPWSRGVTRNDGANYAGYLSPSTPVLREMKLRKGTYQVIYSAIDATGTSSCVVQWRNARSRP